MSEVQPSSRPYDAEASAPLHLVRNAGGRESTVLVVGGAGYVGSIAVGLLLESGYDVIVLDPLLYGGDALTSQIGRAGFRLQVGDTRDSFLVRRLLSQVGAVIHLGEIVGDPACSLDPMVTVAINYTATVRLAELAAEAGVERFIYPSSCSVYGATEELVDEAGPLNPVSLYGRSKRAAEEAILELRSDRFHPTVFRLATVYGLSPRPRFDLVVNVLAGRAAANRAIEVQGGGQWRPFVHVADAAGLLAQTLNAPLERISGEIFNLGSNGQNHTIAGVAEIVRERVPGVAVEVTDGVDRRNYRVSFDKVADVLGFRPTRTVPEGVSEIVRAVENGHILDIGDARHSNVRALVETDGRQRLWQADSQGTGPRDTFRPRDSEVQLPTPAAVRGRRLLEDAVS